MGRDSYSRRRVIEETARLTITDLLSAGLSPSCSFEKSFSIKCSGEDIGAVLYTVTMGTEHNGIKLYYGYYDDEGEMHTRDDFHGIELQRPHFGGYRYHFACNRCGELTKALYFVAPWIGCRHCMNLVYASSRYHRHLNEYQYAANNAERRAEYLRQHRHPRKANRLLWRAHYYGEKDMARFAGAIMRSPIGKYIEK